MFLEPLLNDRDCVIHAEIRLNAIRFDVEEGLIGVLDSVVVEGDQKLSPPVSGTGAQQRAVRVLDGEIEGDDAVQVDLLAKGLELLVGSRGTTAVWSISASIVGGGWVFDGEWRHAGTRTIERQCSPRF